MKITRETTINNKKVQVLDNLLTSQQLDSLVRRFYSATFAKTEVGRPDTASFPHWAHEIPVSEITKEPFWAHTLEGISQFNFDRQWRLYRAYTNYGGFGDTMFSHVDSKIEELTCLWYIVPQWNIDWAGETIFYDDDDEAAFTCVPKPGRLVVFDSRIKHSGRPPARICYHSRFTLALKFEIAG